MAWACAHEDGSVSSGIDPEDGEAFEFHAACGLDLGEGGLQRG